MTYSPMARDFYDETGNPILYLDLVTHIATHLCSLLKSTDDLHAISIGAYDIMGRLEDILLSQELNFDSSKGDFSTVSFANSLFKLAYQLGSIGYYFADDQDHMPTPKIETVAQRKEMVIRGVALVEQQQKQ